MIQRPKYSAMFYYSNGSRRYRLADFPGKLEGIMKRCQAQYVELFKGDFLYEKIQRANDGKLVSSYPNQLTLF